MIKGKNELVQIASNFVRNALKYCKDILVLRKGIIDISFSKKLTDRLANIAGYVVHILLYLFDWPLILTRLYVLCNQYALLD